MSLTFWLNLGKEGRRGWEVASAAQAAGTSHTAGTWPTGCHIHTFT